MTSLAEAIPIVQSLGRADKLRMIQILANEIIKDEGLAPDAVQAYEVWTPYESYEAAKALHEFGEKDELIYRGKG